MGNKRIWYAIMMDEEDTDYYQVGSYDKEVATAEMMHSNNILESEKCERSFYLAVVEETWRDELKMDFAVVGEIREEDL